MSRIEARFAALKAANRAGLVTFITGGDPDHDTSLAVLKALPKAGADVIELGMPFTDPMADGPAIQAASLRALQAGANMEKTFALVRAFRQDDSETPIVLMGYYNPIYAYGAAAFAQTAAEAGVDGLIIVDLPPEEADELVLDTKAAGLDFIVLTTPTTNEARLPVVMERASGFVYYVSILGITGTASATGAAISAAMDRIRAATDLPIAVGFGLKTPDQVAEVARLADAAVVGSAVVQRIEANIGKPGLVDEVASFVASLAEGVRGARR